MVFNLFLCYFVQLIFKKMAKHFYIIGNFKQYNNMKKEKDTYTRYMEYLEKNRSKRARKIALKTCFVYASHYVPLIVIALSVVVIGLLFADVFAFCGAETISDLWFYSIAALLGASIYYAVVRYFTSDIDLLTYDHLPFTRDIHKERREWAKMWAKLQNEINDTEE